MHHRHAAVLIAGLSSIAIGCEAGDAPAPDVFSVTDSAGIEIVESTTPAWEGDGWRVSDTPSVVIGRVEGDERYLFGWINWKNGGVVLRDGRIAVLDGRSALIRMYSPRESTSRTGEDAARALESSVPRPRSFPIAETRSW